MPEWGDVKVVGLLLIAFVLVVVLLVTYVLVILRLVAHHNVSGA